MTYTIEVTQEHIERSRRPEFTYLWHKVYRNRVHIRENILTSYKDKRLDEDTYLKCLEQNREMDQKTIDYYKSKVRPQNPLYLGT